MRNTGENKELNLADLANIRAGIYHILARAFYIPDAETTSPAFVQEIEEIFSCFDIKTGMGALAGEMEDADYITAIKVDFAKLIHGPGKMLAPPYESLYRDGKLVMGDSAVAVTALYRQAGYDLDEQYTNLPDHISAELEFLRHLCYREAQAFAHAQDPAEWVCLQRFFYDRHLDQWVELFCHNVQENAQTDYYREMSNLLKEWVCAEKSLLRS